MDGNGGGEGSPVGPFPRKRRQRLSGEGNNGNVEQTTTAVMVRPCSEARGHTGYLTFARLACI